MGKWRRQITIPTVTACVDNPVDVDPTRLPRNKTEGDIPLIALTTGGADPLECLLRKIGIDDSEFTPAGGTGRVHLYRGRGRHRHASTPAARPSPTPPTCGTAPTDLKKYDVVLLACEGADHNTGNKPYVAAAGRPPRTSSHSGRIHRASAAACSCRTGTTCGWRSRTRPPGRPPRPGTTTRDLANPITATIDQSFPKGAALAQWLITSAARPRSGQIQISAAQHTVDTNNPATTQRWIYADNVDDDRGNNVANTVQYFSFNTPIDAAEANQCGRVVNSDIHVSSGDAVNRPFPTGCTTTDLSPQEKVLEYMFFDIASCIRSDTEPPVVLPPPPPLPPAPPPPAPPGPPPLPPPPPPPAPPPVAPPPPPVPPPPPPIIIN